METADRRSGVDAPEWLAADDRYLANNPTWHAEDAPWKAEQIFGMMSRHRLAPNTVVEVGCGTGLILETLADRLLTPTSLVGYEISPQAFELCSQRAGPRLDFRFADLLTEAPAVCFDVVLCIDVIEHVPDYLGFLKELRERGKCFIFHVPLEITCERLLRPDGFTGVRRRYGHLHHFTRRTALATISDAGYEILDWTLTPSEMALPSKSWRQTLARVPRRLAFALSAHLAARTTGGVSLLVLARKPGSELEVRAPTD